MTASTQPTTASFACPGDERRDGIGVETVGRECSVEQLALRRHCASRLTGPRRRERLAEARPIGWHWQQRQCPAEVPVIAAASGFGDGIELGAGERAVE